MSEAETSKSKAVADLSTGEVLFLKDGAFFLTLHVVRARKMLTEASYKNTNPIREGGASEGLHLLKPPI